MQASQLGTRSGAGVEREKEEVEEEEGGRGRRVQGGVRGGGRKERKRRKKEEEVDKMITLLWPRITRKDPRKEKERKNLLLFSSFQEFLPQFF